jgi:hypothetical protein
MRRHLYVGGFPCPATWQVDKQLLHDVSVIHAPLLAGYEGTVYSRADVVKLSVKARSRTGANIDFSQEGKQPIACRHITAHPTVEVKAIDDLFCLATGIERMDIVAVP